MEKQRRVKILSLVALIVAVLGLTVAFAALSQTLTITGFNEVIADEWNIQFANPVGISIYDGKIETTTDSIIISDDGLSLTFNGKLKIPGDKISISAKVTNAGVIDAKLSEILYGTPVCTSSNGSIEDANNICDNLIISLKYVGGEKNNQDLAIGDDFLNDTSQYIMFVVEFDENASTVPSSDVNIENLNLSLKFEQSS